MAVGDARDRVGGAAPGCPDAERLAEYVDRVLSPADRRGVEEHLLECAAC